MNGKRVSTSAVGSGILAAFPRLGLRGSAPKEGETPVSAQRPLWPWSVLSVLSVRGQGAVGDLDLLGNLTLPLNRN